MRPPASTSAFSANMVGIRCLAANSMMIGRYAVVSALATVIKASGGFCVIAEKALGTSLGSLTSRDCSVTRSLRAADCASCHCRCEPWLVGVQRKATRESFGMASLNSSSRFPVSSPVDQPGPVMFPPGRARLVTSPSSTGSVSEGTMMGIVFVAFLAASTVPGTATIDRKSTRLNSSHDQISYAVFCLKKKRPYGYSMPIAVRYTQDAFSRSGWLWPVDAKGEPLKATSYMAVGFYVAKYVNKKSDMDLAAKGLGAKEWNNSLKTKLSLLPKKLFRIRMSRNFGMKMLTMTNLSTECLIQLTKLGYDATPFNQILKQNAKREMRLRLGKVTVADVLAAQPVTTNLLKFMRASIKMIGVSNLQSFIASMTQKLTLSDISD